MSEVLHHLSLNTSHVAQTPRSDVTSAVIERLVPLIDSRSFQLPWTPDLFVDVMRPSNSKGAPVSGSAFFQLAATPNWSKTPYVMAFCAWHQKTSDPTYAEAVRTFTQLKPVLAETDLWRAPPNLPPPTPWLAVILLPTVSTLGIEQVAMLGDLERCLFWGIVEATGE